MSPSYNKIHNRFKFNGYHFSHKEFKEVAYSLVKEGEAYERVTGDFLIDWLSDNPFIYVNTSGSTGQPKKIKLQKQAMVNSAISTGDFFGLKPGDRAMNCLPTSYIAGKMMLVRAMILGLELDCVEPSSQPIFDYEIQYDFCAMVPFQLKSTIKYVYNIKTLIIGGSKISKSLIEDIKTSPSRFYETYGMTETVTHVALKQLHSKNHKADGAFTAIPNVSFSQDDRKCLVIKAPHLTKDVLTTNDIVNLTSETSFKWLGRFDNVINSGGVKLFPEQIEEKLQAIISNRFIVGSVPDQDLGEKLILVIESTEAVSDGLYESLEGLKTLTKFEIPKAIYTIKQFAETTNGKIQRQKTINLVLG